MNKLVLYFLYKIFIFYIEYFIFENKLYFSKLHYFLNIISNKRNDMVLLLFFLFF